MTTIKSRTDAEVDKLAADLSRTCVEPTSDLEKKIIQQLEFYFGDLNLPKDKYMKKLLLCENGKFKNCFVRGG
jgi:hypothetical protein